MVYSHGGGAAISGLTDGGIYYVIALDANTLSLATTAENAAAGIAINLTDMGSGSAHTLTGVDGTPVVTTYTSSDAPTSIPDQSTITSTLTVDDSFVIGDLNVQLDISHTQAADLDVFLISPTGTRIELFTDVGGSGDNFTGTVLDDEVGQSITTGSAPFAGEFRPEGILQDFDGENVGGSWTLEIRDDRRRETGELLSWSIIVTHSNALIAESEPGNFESTPTSLSQHTLEPIVDEAISRWLATGFVDAANLGVLETMNVEVVDLSGQILGQVQGNTVSFDVNAAGYGWFVDATPDENSEFKIEFGGTEIFATPDSSAYGNFDLLTVALHEVGHLLGVGHSPDGTGVMGDSLTLSSRRLLESSGLDSTENSNTQLSAEILVQQYQASASAAEFAPVIGTNTDAGIFQKVIDDALSSGTEIGNDFVTTVLQNSTLSNRPDSHQIPHPATALTSSSQDDDRLFQAFLPLPAAKRISKLFDHGDSEILSDRIEEAGEDTGNVDDLFADWEKQLVDGVLGITTGVLN